MTIPRILNRFNELNTINKLQFGLEIHTQTMNIESQLIPHICHCFYTDKNFGQKILHRRTRKLRQTDFVTK